MINTISIDDKLYFKTEAQVLNECFNKGYDGFQQGYVHLNEARTIGAWFPRLAKYEAGIPRRQGSVNNKFINEVVDDGRTILSYTEEGTVSGAGNELHFTFAMINNEQRYKYIGTFIKDYNRSDSTRRVYTLVSDHIDLSYWQQDEDEYTLAAESNVSLNGVFGDWEIKNLDLAAVRYKDDYYKNKMIPLQKEIQWFFDVDRLQWADYIPFPIIFNDDRFMGRIETLPKNMPQISLEETLVGTIHDMYEQSTNELILIFRRETSTNGFTLIINQGQEREKSPLIEEKTDPFESEIISNREGKRKEYYTSKYERNSANRRQAIQIHGTKCMICGFDFEKVYGEAGAGFIEVHHIKPLFDLKEEVEVDPKTDLVCLCSNCHRIIHRRRDKVYSIDEVKEMIGSF